MKMREVDLMAGLSSKQRAVLVIAPALAALAIVVVAHAIFPLSG